MGLGRFGGGVASARFLAAEGYDVCVTDRAPAEELVESVAALQGVPVRFALGDHDPALFDRPQLVVAAVAPASQAASEWFQPAPNDSLLRTAGATVEKVRLAASGRPNTT